MSYNANIPQPNDFIDESQVDLLANFTVLDSNYVINHYTFSDQTTNKGKHRYVTMPQQPGGTTPATVLGDGNLFTLPGLGLDNSNKQTQLIYTSDNGGQGYQLSRCIDSKIGQFSNNTNYPPIVANRNGGWTFLPGGMLFQYGIADLAANATPTTIVYPVKFTIGIYSITLSKISSDTSSTGQEIRIVPTPNTTSFQIIQSSSSNANKVYWMAVGQ